MRLAYVCYLSTLALSGVTRKLDAQVAAWRELGNDARLHVLVPARGAEHVRLLELEASGASIVTFESSLGRLVATRDLARRVNREAPDVVHLRYDIFAPPLPLLLRRDLLLVVDIQTNESEFRHRRMTARAYNALQRGLVKARATGVTVVSSELCEAWDSARKPCLVVANGYDLNAARLLPVPATERPRLVILGAVAPWHGADKVVALARLLPEMDVDIVGRTTDLLSGAPANVTFHGELTREQYEPILARADVGIGTLALHRNAMNEASPLKVREYLAYGLPAVIAYADTDFPSPTPFLLQLPNAEDSIDAAVAERVREFVSFWRGRRVQRDAVAHLDIRVKEVKRLEFMEELLRARGAGIRHRSVPQRRGRA
jgi:glycosyltransferase involved in cell wall biosynthesis